MGTSSHRTFHLDDRGLPAYLTRSPDSEHRCELSVLLCMTLLRLAGPDWYEQGNVWAREPAIATSTNRSCLIDDARWRLDRPDKRARTIVMPHSERLGITRVRRSPARL
jgi:hypothetical protein